MELSLLAQLLLSRLPPFLSGSTDAAAVIGALTNEVERLEDAVALLRDNFYPTTADEFLQVWESVLGLPIAPIDKTLAQRRVAVLSFMQALSSSGSGLDWQANLTKLIGTGWTYAEHDPTNPGALPPQWTLLITIPFLPAIAVPSGLGASPSTTGGTMSAGTRYYVVTAINSYGETTPSAQVSATTTGATGKVTLSWTAVPEATGYRVFRGTVSGGPYMHVATVLGTTGYVDTGATATTAQPPTVNTTASPQAADAERLARQITPAHLDLVFGYGQGFIIGVSQVGEEQL